MILDVGANIGAFSLYICGALFESCPKIYAIEPEKMNFALLEINSKLNGFQDSIQCFNVAISDYNGEGFLDTHADFDAYTHMKYLNHSSDQAVKTKTIERFCSEQKVDMVDLMKMDVEGSEFVIFRKNIEFIARRVKSILIEVHYLDDYEDNIVAFKKLVHQ